MLNINQLPFQYPFTPLYLKEFEKMEAYYKSEEPRVREIMRGLIERYHFDNRENRNGDEKETRVIFYFQNSGEQTIHNIGLADKNQDFIKEYIFNEFKPIYTYFENPKIWNSSRELYDKNINLEQFPMELAKKRAEQFFILTYCYFNTWLAYLWQEEKGLESGIYAMTWQNNSARSFCFANFSEDYINIENTKDDKPLICSY